MNENPGTQEEKKRIGDLLLEAGIITGEQLDRALEEQRSSGGRLCYNLIRLGALGADDLLGFLRDQFGVAAVNLDKFSVEEAVLNCLPPAFARHHKVVPLLLLDDTLTVAMMDPGRRVLVEEIEKMTGLKVDPLIAPEATLENAIDKYYGDIMAGGGDAAEEVLTLGDETEEKHLYQPVPPREGYTALEWLKRFILQAIKRRSREIHLEPVKKGLRARFRVGGRLYDGEMSPSEVGSKVTALALAYARIDPRSGAWNPMEGRMKVSVRGRQLRAALSSFPTLYGPRIVIEIMDEGLLGRDFQELGMSREIAEEVSRILHMKDGIFLVNAPPGQGKKTTFYSLLNYLKDEGGRNIMTLEHPIQYPLENVNQTQVTFGKGVDFYYGLKSMLRQNPDVIGLTDINDCRTLEMVFTAARQCLVVGLCSFWDNIQALEWIDNCGIGTTTQAHLIRSLMVQRLLPRLCSHCREQLDAPSDLVEGIREKRPEELVFYTGGGCDRCGKTGRSGRLGIFELLPLRFTIRDMLARSTELQIIYDEAQRQGMLTLQEDGLMKATQGLVDVRDVLDATREESAEE
jgi:type IV pilus assembly protein PilB